MARRNVEPALERALIYLSGRQLPSGEFCSYIMPDGQTPANSAYDSSPFMTSLIVYALGFVNDPRARSMIEKALDFMGGESEGPGVWRFWTRRHPQHWSIPPDMDDTCCVSFLLAKHGRAVPANRAVILANRDARKLFYTWFIPRWPMPLSMDYWRVALPQAIAFRRFATFFRTTYASLDDVDCVVNANALLYLGDSAELQPVADYLVETVRAGREGACDKWYQRPFALYYALSRAYFNGVCALGVVKAEVIERIRRLVNALGAFGDALQTALGVCTLLNYDASPPEMDGAMGYLLESQNAAGAWGRFPFFWGLPGQVYGWGSEELTTGLCLEALARYQQRSA